MAFYWKDKKDQVSSGPKPFRTAAETLYQLFARRGHIPNLADQNSVSWTSFEMPLREMSPIPTPFDFTRFLASSITFMTHIQEIKVFFDDKCLACLTKTSGVANSLSIPKNLNNSSRLGVMTATGINKICTHTFLSTVKMFMRRVSHSNTG